MNQKQYDRAKKVQEELKTQKDQLKSLNLFSNSILLRVGRKERNFGYHDLIKAAQDGLLGSELPIEMIQEIVKYQQAKTQDEIDKLTAAFEII